MVDLSTTYLGLKLRTPLVASASPMWENLDNIKRAADAGASALVLHSLFEEQITREQHELHHHTTFGTDSFAEALSFFPEPDYFHVGPDGYLNHIRKAKDAVNIPIIASLNGATRGGWTSFAKQMADAGADALELNIYYIPTDINTDAAAIEQGYVDILKSVKGAVNIPVAVKLSPFFSNFANMAKKLVDAGADGLVMFNRFYQPDIDLEELEVKPNVILSSAQALRLPLRWIAILYGRLNVNFAATSGIHTHEDAIKALLVGANVTMMTSAVLRNGAEHFSKVERGLLDWLTEREYESVEQMRGSLSQINCPDESAYERAQYARAVSTLPPEYVKYLKR